MSKTFLGIDIGTTNTKAGICDEKGRLLALEGLATPVKQDEEGIWIFEPLELWNRLVSLLEQLVSSYQPATIGITGMSEAGVLVDRDSGEVVSDMLPWSDQRSARFSDLPERIREEKERFITTGLHGSYKYSVYKALTELAQNPSLTHRKLVFLQAPAYIAWRLTGCFATDPTLALRTYAYDLNAGGYDKRFLRTLGLPTELFPAVMPSGQAMGTLHPALAIAFSAQNPITVAVCGHDHMCAALAAGVMETEDCFLSLGTTGVLLGSFPRRTLTKDDFSTGYSYGLHVLPARMTWLGSIQAAGNAVDWCARLTGLAGNYTALDQMLKLRYMRGAGEILFLPYLSGSGAPHLDKDARGAFLGLKLEQDESDLAFSVLEGLAYEIQLILSRAPFFRPPASIRAVGGGTRNKVLLQVLADVTGCVVIASECEQAALTGAALLAGGAQFCTPEQTEIFQPESSRTAGYARRYEQYYLPAQQMARTIFKSN